MVEGLLSVLISDSTSGRGRLRKAGTTPLQLHQMDVDVQ